MSRVVIVAVAVAVAAGAFTVVAWPRLTLGPPVARQVVMSTVPLHAEGDARCWTALTASWHDERVNYYAATRCTGMDASAISVEVEGPQGHHTTSGCRDPDALFLRCAAKEVEGSLHCEGMCAQTVLTVTHTATLPAGTPTPDLGPTACALTDSVLTCSYPVTLHMIAIQNTWSHDGDDHLCVTTPTGQQQIVLDEIGDMAIDTAVVATPAGTAVADATPDALRDVLIASGGLAEVADDEQPGQCDSD